eukprot:gb/GEZN01001602.1/.p1 GENE.gb/GEZN01001602.1/~~gb/GEZN01001602.1/.p1  ORF type:complete len:625 (+),score=122.92 gb/GEZN01001602.1/:258-1877(+)
MFVIRLQNHIKVERQILNEQDINTIFLNMPNIYDFNNRMKVALVKLRMEGPGPFLQKLGSTLKDFIPFFKLYTSFIKTYRKAAASLIEARKRSRFAAFLQLNELCAGHSADALLQLPVSRLPQYLIYLGAIYQNMDQSSTAANELAVAIMEVQQVTDDIATSLRDQVARKLVHTVQTQVFGNKVALISPHRFVVKHGNLKRVLAKKMFSARTKMQIVILFNDMIVYGTRRGMITSGTCQKISRLPGLSVSDEPDAADYKNAFRIRRTGDSVETSMDVLFSAQNPKEKQKWIDNIGSVIASYEENAATVHVKQVSDTEFEDVIFKRQIDGPAPLVNTANSGGTSSPPASPRGSKGAQAQQSSYNNNTSTSTATDKQSEVIVGSVNAEWDKIWDPNHQHYYYEHIQLGHSQWEPPAGWIDPPPPPPPPPTNLVPIASPPTPTPTYVATATTTPATTTSSTSTTTTTTTVATAATTATTMYTATTTATTTTTTAIDTGRIKCSAIVRCRLRVLRPTVRCVWAELLRVFVGTRSRSGCEQRIP